MEGGIYAEDKCPVCQKKFVHDPNRGFICQEHKTRSTRIRVRFRGVRRRFNNYEDAVNFLSGVRFKTKEGTFDERDYDANNPLGFENYIAKYLIKKEGIKSYRHIKQHLTKACYAWQNRNIKTIGFAELDDFLTSMSGLSEKTKHNILTDLHAFWVWVCDREKMVEMPKFPEVSFELEWRNTVPMDIQASIIGKVKEISYHVNPKIWIGIKWLARYISIRPGELINIRECDFDFDLGIVRIRDPKEKKPKVIPMLPEDLEIADSFSKSFPMMYFFRHASGKGIKKDSRFGSNYLWKWWKKACGELGIAGVDLYGGTRHSTAKAMRTRLSYEEVRKASMHSTNKAFERYFKFELNDVRDLYAWGQNGDKIHPQVNKDKVLKLKK